MANRGLIATVSRAAIAAVLADFARYGELRARARREREMEAAWQALHEATTPIREQRRRWLEEMCALQENRCAYCGCAFETGTERRATVDHVVALARGGPDTRENCVAACQRCNELKRDMDAGLFRKYRPWLAGETREPPGRARG